MAPLTTAEEVPLPPRRPGPAHPYDVLRNRDYLLYLVGRLIAVLGQQMAVVAVGWELYDRTGSALSLGLVGLTQMLPMLLFTLPAGHVADNYDRRQIILGTTAVMALAGLGLALVSAMHAPVTWIYVCLFLAGVGRTFHWPASASFLPHLVPRELFSRAVTWNSSTFHLACVVGPAAGGALLAWAHQPAVVYAVYAAAHLLCFALVAAIAPRPSGRRPEPFTLRSLVAGFQFVFHQRVLLGVITLDLFAVLLGGATALLPIFARDILRVGPSGLGLLQTAMPLGAVACALVLAHRPPLQRAGRAMLTAVAVFGLATLMFGFSPWFWLSFLLLVTCGAADNISVVVRHTLVQLLTPDEKRGRVSAVNSLFIGTSNELGGFRAGTVAHWLGPALGNSIPTGAILSVVTGGLGTLLAVLVVACVWPEVRRYGRLDA
ncbi:MAG: MFS transporter [Limisphaera sp.]|nr:MFS transporter [Limisphaera sp.]